MHKLARLKTPIFWAEGHPGKLDRDNWQITVGGLCQRPCVLSWNELIALPQTEVNARLTSVTRWSVGGLWKGVRFSDLLDLIGGSNSVCFVRFWSYSSNYETSISIEVARKEKCLLAWAFDDELLTEDYGGPVRAFIPYLWGYKSAKSIIRIELTDRYVSGFWEQRGYTDDAEIEAGLCRDINDGGKLKHIRMGDEVEFTD
ncbi:MAG: molybdopterin-dependent oxidoreductase [Candidatus Cloacimonetes bacterium]|nr:molybdopterin-dependent oxidoreductase [Candidatus Cloacimonadota bacterium]